MATEYFACLFKLGNVEYYVIWYSDDRDGLVREDGRVLTFPSLEELHTYSIQHELTLKPEETAGYDWDAIERGAANLPQPGLLLARFSTLGTWSWILCVLTKRRVCSRMPTAEMVISTESYFGRTIFPL